MKKGVMLLVAAGAASMPLLQANGQIGPATKEAPAESGWSEWQTRRGHFQFQVRTEEAGAGVMKVRMRIRPDVERIAKEPYYRNETYYLEYWQGIGPDRTGGLGDATERNPRRLKFPPNAPDSCVYEEESLYAPNRKDWIFMDHTVSFEPMSIYEERNVSAFVDVVSFNGGRIGPGNVVRFSGVDQNTFKQVC
ncbi:MAG: hypothetical protein JNN10_08810 [Sphingopyxis sp.]|uniref:hypothetical protein n=1 Tax=Sphingopyxis sp. TaxID=1908224 RepID=UPI001A3B207B|nr:hypothetical protein [Sphingopyxis sp.]MBL9066381.1 hypothetical protein [Sphingopyxis sp.]